MPWSRMRLGCQSRSSMILPAWRTRTLYRPWTPMVFMLLKGSSCHGGGESELVFLGLSRDGLGLQVAAGEHSGQIDSCFLPARNQCLGQYTRAKMAGEVDLVEGPLRQLLDDRIGYICSSQSVVGIVRHPGGVGLGESFCDAVGH